MTGPAAMLSVQSLSKTYRTAHGERALFEGLDFDLSAGARLGVLGRNGQGKSSFIKMLGGVLAPSTGRIDWFMRPSWPLGFSGGFQGSLTGLDNVRFISRIYGQDIRATIDRAEAFAELGEAISMPVKHYSTGMRARLAFGLSLAIEFDCYLIDEIVAVGDRNFRDKCQAELFDRRGDRGFIIASHDLDFIAGTCRQVLIIEDGQAKLFDDVSLAIDIYAALCSQPDHRAGAA